MLKSFRYRLNPTKKQANLLRQQLEECRWLYNQFLGERKDRWEKHKQSVNYHEQATSLPPLKIKRPSLALVHSQVLQNVAVRIDLAFKAFFRRVKAGEKPGYPRFRGQGRYDSMTFPQVPSGCELRDGLLRLSKVGAVQGVLLLVREARRPTLSSGARNKLASTRGCIPSPRSLPERASTTRVSSAPTKKRLPRPNGD